MASFAVYSMQYVFQKMAQTCMTLLKPHFDSKPSKSATTKCAALVPRWQSRLQDAYDAPEEMVTCCHLRMSREDMVRNCNPNEKVWLKGMYAYLREGIYKGQPVVYKKSRTSNTKGSDQMLHQANVMKYLGDTGIAPRIHDVVQSRGSPTEVVMALVQGAQTLTKFLASNPKLTQDQWMDIALQVAAGVFLMHSYNILYNNFLFNHILIQTQPQGGALSHKVTFVDFRQATLYGKGWVSRLDSSHPEWATLAPEMQRGQKSTMKSDVYGLGRILRIIHLQAGSLLPIYDLVAQCVSEKSYDRPSAQDVAKSLFTLRYGRQAGGLREFRNIFRRE